MTFNDTRFDNSGQNRDFLMQIKYGEACITGLKFDMAELTAARNNLEKNMGGKPSIRQVEILGALSKQIELLTPVVEDVIRDFGTLKQFHENQ